MVCRYVMDAAGVWLDCKSEEIETGFGLKMYGVAVKVGRKKLLKVCAVACARWDEA